MAKCEICGKGPQFGYNVSHSKRHTKRRWAVNIRTSSITVGNTHKRVKICTRCLRTRRRVAV